MASVKLKKPKVYTSYTDVKSKGAFGGVARYAKANQISRTEAKKLLQGEESYSLHKPVQRRFRMLPTQVFVKDEQWQADLVEMQKFAFHNRRFRYLLTIIDILTKYAWAVPIKSKTGTNVKAAFEGMFRQGRQPQLLQTDRGTEFYNRIMDTFLKSKGIGHFSTEGDTKGAVIERFNRTLKERLYRYMTANHTKKYIDVLPDIIGSYNEDEHRSIGMAPVDVNDDASELAAWNQLYRKGKKPRAPRPLLKVGEWVRLNQRKKVFKKGYLAQWTQEVFQIAEVLRGDPVVYKLKELDGTSLKGSFYEADLQRVPSDTRHKARVLEIKQRRGNAVLVNWEGWPAKYNTWMTKNEYKKKKAAQRTTH